MKKIGRPSLSRKKRKSRTLQVRLTDVEYLKVENKAKKTNQNISDWIRNLILDLTNK